MFLSNAFEFTPRAGRHGPGEINERGTCLGVYICKSLIEAQGGRVGVRSAGRGQGTTFWFSLPSAPVESR